jgi:integrase
LTNDLFWLGVVSVSTRAGQQPFGVAGQYDSVLTRSKRLCRRKAHLGWPSTRWEIIMGSATSTAHREPWNKGKIVGQKAPFKLKDIWALRVRLQMEHRVRELALFNLGIDSKLRGCDLVALKVRDVCHGDQMATRAIVMQHKTQRPVQFEITLATREALQAWIKQAELEPEDFLFPSRLHASPHLGTRQYARILGHWVDELGLDRADYGTHSMRRTKATLIYRRTKNLRAVQLLLGHSKLESTVRYLGIEVDDALEISEQTEI